MSLARPSDALVKPQGQAFRYSLRGPRLPRFSATLPADAFRAAVLSALHATTGGRESFLLSGHGPDGLPAREHRHAFYLPLFSGVDELDGLLVVSPYERFNQDEVAALSAVRAIRWGGPATRTAVELLDPDDRSCFQVSRRWRSATPYAPPRRFWGTAGKHHHDPERQIVRELQTHLPNVGEINVRLLGTCQARLRLPPGDAPKRPLYQSAFDLVLETAVPICGPLALGHSNHFGLGMLLPDRGVSAT